MRLSPLPYIVAVLVWGLSVPEAAAMGSAPPRDPKKNFALEGELTLDRSYSLALKHYEEVSIKREAIEEAKGNTLSAVGAVVGDFHYIIEDRRQDSPDSTGGDSAIESSSNIKTRTDRRFTYEQTLFDGFKSWAAWMGAGNLNRQRTAEYNRYRQLLFLDVSKSFYQTLKLREETRLMEETRLTLDRRMTELDERERIGRTRPAETAETRSRLKRLDADIAKKKGELESSLLDLSFLTSSEVSADALREPAIPELKLIEASSDIEKRPDVKASHENSEVKRMELWGSQNTLWPAITLETNMYERREGFQADNDWDVLLKFDIPLFDGGATFGEMKKKLSQFEAARWAKLLAIREARYDLAKSESFWRHSIEEYEASLAALEAAEENYRLQEADYGTNLISNLDLLDSLESLLEARKLANESRFRLHENYWKLKVALNECCAEV